MKQILKLWKQRKQLKNNENKMKTIKNWKQLKTENN